MPVRTNHPQWERAIQAAQKEYRDVARYSAQVASEQARDAIRRRIPPGAISAGMTHSFPGYAARGRLKASVQASPVQEAGYDRFIARVSIQGSDLVQTYAYVHEEGMIIRARRRPYLVFQILGRWRRAKSVRIRQKRFFAAGIEEIAYRFPEIIGQVAARHR